MKLRTMTAGLLALSLLSTVAANAAGLKIPHFGVYIPSAGGIMEIPIVVDSLPGEIGGFRLCLAERGHDFSVVKVEPGELMTSCGWEYLNWRRIPLPEELTDWPSFQWSFQTTGLIEITGFASTTNGFQAACFGTDSRMELVKVKVALATPSWGGDVNTDCSARPLMFFWRDCNDNLLYSRNLDTGFTANGVLWPWQGFSPSDSLTLAFPGFGSPDQSCLSGPLATVPSFTAVDGYYDIICADDSVSPWLGDINCDGYPFTLADVIAYSRFFVWGLGVFNCQLEQVIGGSDINQDGLVLTVADLTLLTRIAIGDISFDPIWYSSEFTKPTPVERSAEISLAATGSSRACTLHSDDAVAACYLRLVGTGEQPLSASSLAEIAPGAMVGSIGDTVTLLWIDRSGEVIFPAGDRALFTSGGASFQIVHAEIVDMDVRPMAVTMSQTLPAEFRLSQNVPNPFNPSTVIEFQLPTAGYATLDVYNVNGQMVARLVNGLQTAGIHQARWDGIDQDGNSVASGLYFYRLTIGTEQTTRKMLLLK